MKSRLVIAALFCVMLASAQTPPKKLTWEEQLELILPPLTEQLELDGLQEAAIRNILMNQFRQNDLITKDSRFDEKKKREEAKLLIDKTEADIKALLTPNQVARYDKYVDDIKNGKKPRRKKK